MAAQNCHRLFWAFLFFLCHNLVNANQLSCKENEVWQNGFAAEPSCDDLFPVFNFHDFKEGCFCKDDYVRNAEGKCILIRECPQYAVPVGHPASNTPLSIPTCAEGEEFKVGYHPEPSCNNILPILEYYDSRLGCFCKENYVRNSTGSCISIDECPQYKDNPYKHHAGDCPENEHYGLEGYPVKTCANLFPMQYDERLGCFCDNGYVRNISGRCVKVEDCPKYPQYEDDDAGRERRSQSKPGSSKNNHRPGEVYKKNNKLCVYVDGIKDVCTAESTPKSSTSAQLCEPFSKFDIDSYSCFCDVAGQSAFCIPKGPSPHACGINEVYDCQRQEYICGWKGVLLTLPTNICKLGCYCKYGFARNEQDVCISFEACNKIADTKAAQSKKPEVNPSAHTKRSAIPPVTNQPGDVYKNGCDLCVCKIDGNEDKCTKGRSCSENPIDVPGACPKTKKVCNPGSVFIVDCYKCRCDESGKKAKCDLLSCCPDKCPPNEEFLCKKQEPVCDRFGKVTLPTPSPECEYRCFCKDGFSRNDSGKCVKPKVVLPLPSPTPPPPPTPPPQKVCHKYKRSKH